MTTKPEKVTSELEKLKSRAEEDFFQIRFLCQKEPLRTFINNNPYYILELYDRHAKIKKETIGRCTVEFSILPNGSFRKINKIDNTSINEDNQIRKSKRKVMSNGKYVIDVIL